MQRPTPIRRRATVLIMVVSLLALLFVIVTGFLAQSRYNQQILQTVRRADLPADVLDSTNGLALDLIRRQLIDGNGSVLVSAGGTSLDVDIPGYRQAYYLGSNEPVWDYSGRAPRTQVNFGVLSGDDVLRRVIWPALTRLEGDSSVKPAYRALFELIPENERDQDGAGRMTVADVESFAFSPVGDADADGFPDTDPLFTATAIETANNLAGLPVYLPDPLDPSTFSIAAIPDPALVPSAPLAMWRNYRENGRFDVPVRIISHGGMVTFDAPAANTPMGALAPPQREFVIDLFDRLRGAGDPAFRQSFQGQAAQDYVFGQLASSRSGVEAALRRRFALPSLGYDDPLSSTDVLRRVPPALALLETGWGRSGFAGFRGTLVPTFAAESAIQLSPNSWQRLNIAGDPRGGLNNPRSNWANTLAYDVDRFNTNSVSTQQATYTRRHQFTGTNNSDELARKQQRGEPDFTDATRRLRTYRGELKYYLGEIAKAFDQVGAGQHAFNPVRGRVIIDQLARFYYDMLDSHEGWEGAGSAGLFEDDPGTGNDQVLTRRQQALSLAVNTVAFAAPRDTAGAFVGWIDTVFYPDVDPTTGEIRIYTGYAPQPYFSEVIAYDNTIPDDQGTDPADEFVQGRLSIAVELFNPSDPYYNGATDVFALNMSQFAISVGNSQPADGNPFTTRQFVDTGDGQFVDQQFEGRSFTTIVLRDNNPALPPNDHFVIPGLTPNVELSLAGAGNWVTLNLWRKARRFINAAGNDFDDVSALPNEGWVLVDRIQVRRPRPPADFDAGPPPSYPPDTENWTTRYRDLAPSAHYASLGGPSDDYNYARWGVDVAYDDSYEWSDRQAANPADNPINEFRGYNGPQTLSVLPNIDPSLEQRRTHLTDIGIQDPIALGRRVPEAPLITMNAGPVGAGAQSLYQRMNNLPLFGNVADLRPRSFPTPGFLLFVPRYAHVQRMDLADARRVENGGGAGKLAARSASLTLDKERARFNLVAATAPADFGHMPVFDNDQDVDSNSLLGRVGKLPWGLMVFEYFTTLNPNAPGVDPMKVPGRININTAPWYTLASVPLLGPNPTNEELVEIRANAGGSVAIGADPSPSFWDWRVGVMTGVGTDPYTGVTVYRQISRDPDAASDARNENLSYAPAGKPPLLPRRTSQNNARHRLGAWLAQSAVSYRDGVQYIPAIGSGSTPYWDAHARGGTLDSNILPNVPLGPYRSGTYGTIRGTATGGTGPTEYGFVSLGEMLNVKGMDGTRPLLVNDTLNSTLGRGDFVRAVSLMALLDTQWLTTRSNTFTVYASVTDRDEPQASLRSQVTVDRTPMLPHLTYYDPRDADSPYYSATDFITPRIPTGPAAAVYAQTLALGGITIPAQAVTLQRIEDSSAPFEVVSERRASLLNARFDE